MAVRRYECGKRRFFYAHWTFHKNHQFGRSENHFRNQAVPVVLGLCGDIFTGYWPDCKRDHAIVKTLPNRFDTILDETTSSVDTRTELITQRAMNRLTEYCTSFVIVHH